MFYVIVIIENKKIFQILNDFKDAYIECYFFFFIDGEDIWKSKFNVLFKWDYIFFTVPVDTRNEIF